VLLCETIENSITAIVNKRAALENRQHASTYKKALCKLDSVAKQLKDTLDCAIALKQKGIIDEPLLDEPSRKALLDCINVCGNGIAQLQLTQDAVNVLNSKAEGLSSQLRVVWKDGAARYSGGTKGYLTTVSGVSKNPQSARELAERIDKIACEEPSVSAADKLIDYVSKARVITESFDLNPSIEAFLKKVSAHKATIADLTPAVMQWLEDKGLTDRLQITF